MNIKRRLDYIVKKIRACTGKVRQAMRENYWCAIEMHEEEIEQGPGEVIRELKNKENGQTTTR